MSTKKKDLKVQLLQDRYSQEYDRFMRAEAKLTRAFHVWEKSRRKVNRLLKRLCDSEEPMPPSVFSVPPVDLDRVVEPVNKEGR